MKDDMNMVERHRLFAAKADGTITPEEHECLAVLLKRSEEARREWFRFQDAEAALLAWAQRELLRGEEPFPETEAQKSAASEATPRPAWKSIWLPLAACLSIAALVWAAWPNPVNPNSANAIPHEEATTSSVAMLARGVNLKWDHSAPAPAVNAPLAPGLLRLESGVAEIEFFQGARLCIEGPAEIRLVSSGEAFCQYGRFSAHVPPQARGFRLSTPKGDIVDLGTDFGLDLSEQSPTVHVFKGQVELHQPRVQTRTLIGGTAAGLDQPAQLIAANAATFAFSHNLDEQVSASRREALTRWREASTQRDADPDLRLHLDFQDDSGTRSLRNTATNGGDIAAGTIVGCNWTEGRWPGKRALQFHSVSDRVRLNLPGEYPQFTLAAWVQLDSLNARQSQSSLCMSQGLEVGGVHWQVVHSGALCLGIIAEAHPSVTDDYISPVVFTPERFGQWVHLAAVFDTAGKEVRFYVDGERLTRLPLKRAITPVPVMAELGNWIPSTDYRGPHPVRNFVGCMDEFSFYARSLSDDEVRQLAR